MSILSSKGSMREHNVITVSTKRECLYVDTASKEPF